MSSKFHFLERRSPDRDFEEKQENTYEIAFLICHFTLDCSRVHEFMPNSSSNSCTKVSLNSQFRANLQRKLS